jgi:hypothetical protein
MLLRSVHEFRKERTLPGVSIFCWDGERSIARRAILYPHPNHIAR